MTENRNWCVWKKETDNNPCVWDALRWRSRWSNITCWTDLRNRTTSSHVERILIQLKLFQNSNTKTLHETPRRCLNVNSQHALTIDATAAQDSDRRCIWRRSSAYQHTPVSGSVTQDCNSLFLFPRGLCLVDADPTTYSHPENWSYFEPEAMLWLNYLRLKPVGDSGIAGGEHKCLA